MTLPSYPFLYLGLAIVLEICGTASLAKAEQFTRLLPSIGVVLSYAGSFYFFSHALKSIPVGIAYAIWSCLGIVVISAIGAFFFKQHLDVPAYIGLGLIIAGVVVINLFSSSISH